MGHAILASAAGVAQINNLIERFGKYTSKLTLIKVVPAGARRLYKCFNGLSQCLSTTTGGVVVVSSLIKSAEAVMELPMEEIRRRVLEIPDEALQSSDEAVVAVRQLKHKFQREANRAVRYIAGIVAEDYSLHHHKHPVDRELKQVGSGRYYVSEESGSIRRAKSVAQEMVEYAVGTFEYYLDELKELVRNPSLRAQYAKDLAEAFSEFPDSCKGFLDKIKKNAEGVLYELIDEHRKLISPPCNAKFSTSTSRSSTPLSSSPKFLSTTPLSPPSPEEGLDAAQMVLYFLGAGLVVVAAYYTGKVILGHKGALFSHIRDYASTSARNFRTMFSHVCQRFQTLCRSDAEDNLSCISSTSSGDQSVHIVLREGARTSGEYV